MTTPLTVADLDALQGQLNDYPEGVSDEAAVLWDRCLKADDAITQLRFAGKLIAKDLASALQHQRELAYERDAALAVSAPARRLLALYDLRFDLANREKNGEDVRDDLRKYGEQKKADWQELREALAKLDSEKLYYENPIL